MVTNQMILNLKNKARRYYYCHRYSLCQQAGQAIALLEAQQRWEREQEELQDLEDWLQIKDRQEEQRDSRPL